MVKQFTCIVCPVGCLLTVEGEGKKIISVTGNSCPRGKAYAESEFTAPVRTVTSTVRAKNGGMIPVRTSGGVPKEDVLSLMKAISACHPDLPVNAGDVLILELVPGVDLVAVKVIEL